MDEYVRDILDNTSESTEQVTIAPDGTWSVESAGEPQPKKPRHSGARSTPVLTYPIDDDDVVPLDGYGAPNDYTTRTPSRLFGTPASTPLNGVSTPNPSKKRPAAEVIDLTLSDSDDEPPAPKRQNTGQPLNGLTFPQYPY
jgi:E3 SUMO-protein ligase PIAS1